MDQLINKIEAKFGVFPKLNDKYIKLIVKYLPLIVSLEMVLLSLKVMATLTSNKYLEAFKISTENATLVSAYLTSITIIVFGFLVLTPSLLMRKMTGWYVLFYFLVVRFLVESIFVIFNFTGSLFGVFSHVIVFLASFYLLFQIRSSYKKVENK